MSAFDLKAAGRFEEAIVAYGDLLAKEPGDIAWVDGLAQSYCGKGDYRVAIPLMHQVHAYQKKKTPDHPGQQLELGAAHWCLDDRPQAIQLVRELCAGILNRSVNMAPDLAGGATFGLILHYMSATVGDDDSRDYALRYLHKLNVKYDKRPTLFFYPKQTVKQVLGLAGFEDALEGATKQRSLVAARQSSESNRSVKMDLGVCLFHDGVMHRVQGNEAACAERMKQVYDLGYRTEHIRWYLARHEVLALT